MSVPVTAVFFLACTLAAAGPALAAEDRAPAERSRRVLVLYTDRADLPANVILDRSIRSTLEAGGIGPLDIYAESLDVSRFAGAEQAKLQSDFLARRYSDRKPDVVITISDSAVDFLVRLGAGLFPGTPIVVGSTEQRGIRNWPLPQGITGAVGTVQFRTTLELILALHPHTRRVVVLAGASAVDRYWAEQMIRDVRTIDPGIEVVDTGPLPMAHLLREVAAQPPRTVILYHTLFRDGAGEPFVPARVVAPLTQAANVPVYGVYETHLGLGIVGGHLWSFERQGAKAAEVALRILRGERAEDIPLVNYESHVYMFDWRQLVRWGIDEARLPAGSIVRFRQPSAWDTYKWHILAALLVILAQSALITGLVLQRRGRVKAEVEVRHRRAELAQGSRLALAGELTASIAHEINQPLGAILANAGAAEALLRRDPAASEELREILADIRKADLRASEIIRRVRALVTMRQAEREPVHVNTLIGEVLAFLRGEAERRAVVVDAELASGLSALLVDRVQVQQAVVNLCINGMEAMADCTVGKRRLGVRTACAGDGGIEIAVSDTGPGIAAEHLPRVFDSFFTTKAHGTGLGLAITRSIVEAHDGTLSVENRDAGGALFRMILPVPAQVVQ